MSRAERMLPLFVDTNALVAAFDEDDERHELADSVFNEIQTGERPYGPLFISRYILSETATTILKAVGHREAVDALTTVRTSSSFNILNVNSGIFDETVSQFSEYEDQSISFIDHMNAVLANEYDIQHIFAFDQDFATLGLTRVPVDTGEP